MPTWQRLTGGVALRLSSTSSVLSALAPAFTNLTGSDGSNEPGN